MQHACLLVNSGVDTAENKRSVTNIFRILTALGKFVDLQPIGMQQQSASSPRTERQVRGGADGHAARERGVLDRHLGTQLC